MQLGSRHGQDTQSSQKRSFWCLHLSSLVERKSTMSPYERDQDRFVQSTRRSVHVISIPPPACYSRDDALVVELLQHSKPVAIQREGHASCLVQWIPVLVCDVKGVDFFHRSLQSPRASHGCCDISSSLSPLRREHGDALRSVSTVSFILRPSRYP
jgi:hypothetical protein